MSTLIILWMGFGLGAMSWEFLRWWQAEDRSILLALITIMFALPFAVVIGPLTLGCRTKTCRECGDGCRLTFLGYHVMTKDCGCPWCDLFDEEDDHG